MGMSKIQLVNRSTPLGNKYRIGVDGDRETVVRKHRRYLMEGYRDGTLTSEEMLYLKKLRNQYLLDGELNLGCHCAPLGCHAVNIRDVVINMSEEPLITLVYWSPSVPLGPETSMWIQSMVASAPWSIKTIYITVMDYIGCDLWLSSNDLNMDVKLVAKKEAFIGSITVPDAIIGIFSSKDTEEYREFINHRWAESGRLVRSYVYKHR